MSSMSRSIIRQAKRNRLNTVSRRVCPDCGGILKASSPTSYVCKKCHKRFKPKKTERK